MKYFAGLDLSEIEVSLLSWRECLIIEQAFTTNFTKLYGAVDYAPTDQVKEVLSKYIKLNLVETEVAGYFDLEQDEFAMALAIYMMPEHSSDPLIQQYKSILSGLPESGQIQALKAQPYSLALINDLWVLLAPYKDKLNLTGFWDKSVHNLSVVINNELYSQIYARLHNIEKPPQNLQFDLAARSHVVALQIIYYMHLLHYLHKRERRYDVLYTLKDTDFNWRDLKSIIFKLLKDAIAHLQQMPEPGSEFIDLNTCKVLMFRSKHTVQKALHLSCDSIKKIGHQS